MLVQGMDPRSAPRKTDGVTILRPGDINREYEPSVAYARFGEGRTMLSVLREAIKDIYVTVVVLQNSGSLQRGGMGVSSTVGCVVGQSPYKQRLCQTELGVYGCFSGSSKQKTGHFWNTPLRFVLVFAYIAPLYLTNRTRPDVWKNSPTTR